MFDLHGLLILHSLQQASPSCSLYEAVHGHSSVVHGAYHLPISRLGGAVMLSFVVSWFEACLDPKSSFQKSSLNLSGWSPSIDIDEQSDPHWVLAMGE